MKLLRRVFGGSGDSQTKYQCSACPETFDAPADAEALRCPVCGDRNVAPL
ncbi:hypothetical protein [Halomarina pelagica]|nr:hypothetical protein [Halomarina sp. BND7]